MKTISIPQRVAAVKQNKLQQNGTKATKTSFALVACVILFLGTFVAPAQVIRTLGTLPPGGTVKITFDVTINTPFPANTASVTNQGIVTGTGFGPILTDDPATGAFNDPTVTGVTVAPQITCPADIVTNGFGACVSAIPFSTAVTAGVPSPTLVYELGPTVITSPYVFPAGTNTVTVTATNGTAPNATCSFTVVVLAGAAPELSVVSSGTNIVVSWPASYSCYSLEHSSAFVPPPGTNVWAVHPGPFTTNAGNIYITNGIGPTNQFFRLAF